jgi:glyoxylase-like metal-dependent hydrolase (beta-lactamase superfamily II)
MGWPVTKPLCSLIEIPQEIAGFNRFVGSWVFQGDLTLVVDVGPANSSAKLINALTRMGVDRVDFFLITHIHIDHAGALASCLEHFPIARVVCHEKGITHLVDPSRLWRGSREVLGEIAEAYGRPRAVGREKFIPHTETRIEDLAVVNTPGHAAHHLSFGYGGHLFTGEAAGNYYAFGDRDYLRPATPPKFFFQVFLNSLDRLKTLKDMPICYAHWGHAASSHQMLDRFQAQLERWKEIIGNEISSGTEDLVVQCVEILLDTDPELKAFDIMTPDVQERERYFLSNSVKGYIGFLQGNSG